MQVKDINSKGAVDEIVLRIESIDEPRAVRDGALSVANATASDETGTITLTLWNKDIEKVKTGDTVKITKGWVGDYQGSFQLSAGKFGQIEVISSDEQAAAESSNADVDSAIDDDII